MDSTKLLSSDLLQKVFNEIECLEDLGMRAPKSATKSGFLEDVMSLEKEMSSIHRQSNKKKNFFFENSSKSLQDKSEVHEDLTDSSEDESSKYFEETNYNECGKNLKKLIKNRASSKPAGVNVLKTEYSWKKPNPTGEKLKTEFAKICENVINNQELLRDPVLKMNIINPLFSSVTLEEKLMGRISISTSKVKQFVQTTTSKDSNWVTGGAVVGKFTRTSQKGNPYCVWHVSDLNGDIKMICVLLFGSAYKEYWKIPLGTVVGILNPLVLDNKEKYEATLRVDNAQKILIMGISKDYSLCKSKKKNGENCSSVVNKSKCDYCIYHMKKEYNKACRRSDLQPPKIGRNVDHLKVKVLGKGLMYRNGKTFIGISDTKAPRPMEKDKQRMKLLSQSPVSVLQSQKDKDDKAVKRLNQNSEHSKNKDITTVSKSESQMVDLTFTISKKERYAAKANALRYIREQGSLKKVMDDHKSKRTPEHISFIKRKLEMNEENKMKKLKLSNGTSADSLKSKYLKNGITDEFLKLMNSETQSGHLLKMAENEEREKYFNKLEMKEKLENKMEATFKVECKAVRCLKCNYKAFSASELCKKEKHPLKVINAIKRFWKCRNCSARTVCLELVPLCSCKVCGSSKWERASMMPEKKDSNLTKIPLSLRGDEETFLGAAAKQANLNLLVP